MEQTQGPVKVRRLCERLAVAPGSVTGEVGLPEGCLRLPREGSGTKRPAIGVVPVAAANFSTARWPLFPEGMILSAAGFSVATVARAASRSLSQVLVRFTR